MAATATRTVDWVDGAVELIDQTRLPHETRTLRISAPEDLAAAIKRLSVRGAPAIGVAGAFGVALARRAHEHDTSSFSAAVEMLRSARPTAVNLARMVDRAAARASEGFDAVLAEAAAIRDEELAASVSMGEYGADLVETLVRESRGESRGEGRGRDARGWARSEGRDGIRVMTICNTGGLASVERGTALAVVQTLHERGRLADVLALETRPLLQGGRLTTWELARMGAPHRLVVDSAGPFLLARGEADVVLTGADRVVANGDTANKIGTFSLALGARYAGAPFVVVAPESTVDTDVPSGEDIEIEDRGPGEVVGFGDTLVAPRDTPGLNPAFDVTPASLIDALVTDRRVVRLAHGETLDGVAPGPVRAGQA